MCHYYLIWMHQPNYSMLHKQQQQKHFFQLAPQIKLQC